MNAKAHKKSIDAASKRLDAAMGAVYASAPSNAIPFSDCLPLTSQGARDEYHSARASWAGSRDAAIEDGKAYYGTYGILVWYK